MSRLFCCHCRRNSTEDIVRKGHQPPKRPILVVDANSTVHDESANTNSPLLPSGGQSHDADKPYSGEPAEEKLFEDTLVEDSNSFNRLLEMENAAEQYMDEQNSENEKQIEYNSCSANNLERVSAQLTASEIDLVVAVADLSSLLPDDVTHFYKRTHSHLAIRRQLSQLRYERHVNRRRHAANRLVRGIRMLPGGDSALYTSAEALLRRFSSKWNFNIFALDRLTGNRSFYYMGMHLFQYYDLLRHFQLDPLVLSRSLCAMEELYHSHNPYHNAIHAADVAQAMHCFLQQKKLASVLDKLDIMAAVLGALCHDIDHPGKTAFFVKESNDIISQLYNGKGSILERHHFATLWSVVQHTGLFDHLTRAQLKRIYWLMEELILATDIALHRGYMDKLDSLTVGSDDSEKRLELCPGDSSEHLLLSLQVALKCADVCNPARPWPQCRAWARLIVAEFFAQGDAERAANRNPSPNMDRQKNKLEDIQVGFIGFIVDPLFDKLDLWLSSKLSRAAKKHVLQNTKTWKHLSSRVNGKVAPTTAVELSPLSEETTVNHLRRNSLPVAVSSVASAANKRRSSLQHETRINNFQSIHNPSTSFLKLDDYIKSCASSSSSLQSISPAVAAAVLLSPAKFALQPHRRGSEPAANQLADFQQHLQLLTRAESDKPRSFSVDFHGDLKTTLLNLPTYSCGSEINSLERSLTNSRDAGITEV